MMESDRELREEFVNAQRIHSLMAWTPRETDLEEGFGSLRDFKAKRASRKGTRLALTILSYAASVCAAVALTVFATGRFAAGNPAFQNEEFTAPCGQRAVVTLMDGTEVWLNSNTTLRILPSPRRARERRVELDGEAYFEVARDERKPFVVSTKEADVKVLGTKFSVFSYEGDERFSASLVEGSVQVSANDGEDTVTLKPDEMVEMVDGALVKGTVEEGDWLSWKEGVYSFENRTLSEIAGKLEVYYGIKISIHDDKLSETRYSGKFRQGDKVENILKALQAVRPFRFTTMPDGSVVIR